MHNRTKLRPKKLTKSRATYSQINTGHIYKLGIWDKLAAINTLKSNICEVRTSKMGFGNRTCCPEICRNSL